jgi:hypothetical protein
LLSALLITSAASAETLGNEALGTPETSGRVQVVEGRIATSGLQLFRVTGLNEGETLYVHASSTSGNLDPLVALLKPEVLPDELAREPLDQLVETLSRDQDPTEVTRQLFDRYALAGNDDFEGHYSAGFSFEIPEDGDYRLAIGSSLIRPSTGNYRLVVGTDEPDVLSGRPTSSGPTFVFPEKDAGVLERGVVSVTGELTASQAIRYKGVSVLVR